jgi:AmpE protein
MSFLALLLALLLWNFWPKSALIQNDSWLQPLYKILRSILPATFALVLTIALPVMVITLLVLVVEHHFFGLLTLLFSVIVVVYGLGRGDLRLAWLTYVDEWQRGNYEAAYQQAIELGGITKDELIEDSFALHQQMRGKYCYYGLERWFAPIFWFMALGPAAIVAYRVVITINDWQGDETLAARKLTARWCAWLEYIPARLLALTFALAANFSAAFGYFQDKVFVQYPVDTLVAESAEKALELPDALNDYGSPAEFIDASTQELGELKNLLKRSQIVWLLVLGFMMLL